MMNLDGLSLFDWMGLAGVLAYVGNYLMLQLGLMSGTSYTYIGLNILAAALVLTSLSQDFNMSSAIIQITWIVISCIGIARRLILSRATRLTPEERAFAAEKLPGLTAGRMAPFLRAGHWVNAPAGTVLTTEGQPLNALIYLARGTARIDSAGVTIGTCTDGAFLGELTCFDGAPATATATLETDARYFIITTPQLLRVCRRHPEFGIRLETALGADTKSKLKAANARLHAASTSFG